MCYTLHTWFNNQAATQKHDRNMLFAGNHQEKLQVITIRLLPQAFPPPAARQAAAHSSDSPGSAPLQEQQCLHSRWALRTNHLAAGSLPLGFLISLAGISTAASLLRTPHPTAHWPFSQLNPIASPLPFSCNTINQMLRL